MNVALAVTLVLTAADGARPLKLASPGLQVVNIEAKEGAFYTEHVAQQLKLIGVEILTVREIESLLGMERQRQLFGCGSDSSSCIAELANALGADGVLLGDVARLGSRWTVNLKIIGANDGKTLAAFSETARSDDEVVDTLTRGARKLAVEGSAALGRQAPRVEAERLPLRKIAVAPLALGVMAAALGVGLVVWSDADYTLLKTGMPLGQGEAVASRGQTNGALGVASLIAGGVALAAGAVLFVLGADSPKVVVTAGPTGGAVLLSGVFP